MKYLLTYKLFEQVGRYTEIEFVCYNTETGSSTTKENQRNLYNELKNYENSLLPYLQDWSDDHHEEISLAVIILDKENEEYYKNLIETLSDINGVDIDLVTYVTDKRINEILRGELESLTESNKEDDIIGKDMWFEYHCFESPASADAEAWYRSHQKVKVLERGDDDHDEFPDEPKIYRIKFEDGLEYDVFDDELMKSPDEFYRPDPPLKESKQEVQKTTDKQLKKRWDKKRAAILKLGKDIKRLRQKVSKDMDSEDEKTRMVATIIRIMDLTGERIGNENSKSEGHHGVSNFYKKHIKINDGTVSFSYTGKSGVKHKVSLKDSKVIKNLKEFMEIPGEVFVTTDGLSIKSTQVNNYLSDFDITSKDLRGYLVNKLMSERLRKLKKPDTIGEIKKKFNEVLRDVAEQIGHTPGICRKNYLLPEIEDQWYKGKEVQKV